MATRHAWGGWWNRSLFAFRHLRRHRCADVPWPLQLLWLRGCGYRRRARSRCHEQWLHLCHRGLSRGRCLLLLLLCLYQDLLLALQVHLLLLYAYVVQLLLLLQLQLLRCKLPLSQ